MLPHLGRDSRTAPPAGGTVTGLGHSNPANCDQFPGILVGEQLCVGGAVRQASKGTIPKDREQLAQGWGVGTWE